MLTQLLIKNYVLIRHLHLDLTNGLNTITGETGAGKSIMLGAVGLLLGNRADTKSLLLSDQKCVIEGHFLLKNLHLEDFFENEDLDYQEQTIIRREISPSGKSRAFINDTPVLLDSLKTIGQQLIDIHSQHDTLLLSSNSFQLKLIDSAANNAPLKADYKNKFKQYIEANKYFLNLQKGAQALKQEHDYNTFLLDELSKLNLKEINQKDFEDELNMLEHAEEIKLALSQVTGLLDQNEYSAGNIISESKTILNRISSYSEKLNSFNERTESLLIELLDLKAEIESEESKVEYDPSRLEELKEILNEIYRLQKKHGVNSTEELLRIEEKISDKVIQVTNLDDDLDKAERLRAETKAFLAEAGEKLTLSRKSVFPWICEEVERLLTDLSIPEARLEIKAELLKEPSESGCDHIQFMFSANRGIPAQELRKVASGGEFSRLMFAFKYLMAGKTTMPTFIFDEIDAGVSGEVARQLGLMMRKMGEDQQVITITHLPQVAAYGKKHFFVYKDATDQTTTSHIRELQGEERILELAKMISGDQPSEAAITSARELIIH